MAVGCLGRSGDVAHGHEFHGARFDGDPPGWESVYPLSATCSVCREWGQGALVPSYQHLHLPSHPEAFATLMGSLQRR